MPKDGTLLGKKSIVRRSRIHAFGNPSKLSLTNHRTAPLLIRIKHFLCALRSISEKIHLKILKISDNFSPKRTFDRTLEFYLCGYGKIYQVGSLLWSNQLSCLGDGFYTPLARISKDKCSGPPNNALSPCNGPIHRIWTLLNSCSAYCC